MNVPIKSSNGITLVPIETRLLADRKIFIEGKINAETACEFVKKVMYLNTESSEKSIQVLINSPGGEINAGMLMYDVIQSSKAPIRPFCIGLAYSMGALLFASGNHGRYMLPNSELMIHEPLISSGIGGSASSVKSISDSLMEARRKINRILAKHTGKTEEEIEAATHFDHYLTPEESVEFGLCDEIIDFSMMMEG